MNNRRNRRRPPILNTEDSSSIQSHYIFEVEDRWPQHPPIAYQVKRSDIEPLLKKPLFADTSLPDEHEVEARFDRLKLIGLQVEFNKNLYIEENVGSFLPIPQLQFTQVYFDETPNQENEESYFLRYADLADNKLLLTHTMAIQLDELNSESQEYELNDYQDVIPYTIEGAVTDNKYIQHRLDFYSPIGYVYFPKGQLDFLIRFYECLIFSGIQLNFGKRLAKGNRGEAYDETYFSLKIEGDNPRIDTGEFRMAGFDQTDGADLLIGHPCPPFWQLFINMMAPVIENSDDQDNLFNNIHRIWEDWQEVIEVTWPPHSSNNNQAR